MSIVCNRVRLLRQRQMACLYDLKHFWSVLLTAEVYVNLEIFCNRHIVDIIKI